MSTLMYKDNDTWVEFFGSMPVGSIYISYNSTSPSTIWGGTWSRVTDAVLRANSGSTIGYTGSDTVTIESSNLPAHSHKMYLYPSSVGGAAQRNEANTLVLERIYYPKRSNPSTDYWVETESAGTNGTSNSSFSILPRRFEVYIWYRTA